MGLILIDKPKGITSAKVVNLIKKKFKIKAGHTGTLDPSASGLLIVLTGNSTKKFSHFLKFPKVYEVQALLGISTGTFDLEGKVLEKNSKKIKRKELLEVLKHLHGDISQTPPAFSAKKIKGKEAYKIVRKGGVVSLKPQKVKIYSLKLVSFKYPKFKLLLKVSSGFYVRSLINDIGKKLKVGASVSEIRRIEIGPYHLSKAKKLNEILDGKFSNLIKQNKI